MLVIRSDIQLGSSTKQFLEYGRKKYSEEKFIACIKKSLMHKAKTHPTKIARRLGSLITTTHEHMQGDVFILRMINLAFHEVEKELRGSNNG